MFVKISDNTNDLKGVVRKIRCELCTLEIDQLNARYVSWIDVVHFLN